MAKFCKLFEDKKGEQLLVLLTQSEENDDRADVTLHFDMEGAAVKVRILGADWDACDKYLENFQKETALVILKDPQEWIESLLN